MDYLAGGSSSGSAAAVVDGIVDAALGTDQAGSVRLPAAWCGCVGYKPTYGLVPYTGTVGLGPSFDSIGMLTSNVEDAWTLLSVCAGPDGLDPRQFQASAEPLDRRSNPAPRSISVGVVSEGFGWEESEAAVDDAVLDALETCENGGMDVDQLSIPMHEHGAAIHRGVSTEETAALLRHRGVGRYLQGFYDSELAEYMGRMRRRDSDALPVTLQSRLVLGDYLADEYDGQFHAAAQNRRPTLRAAYDEALAEVDVLAMPTATKLPHAVDPEAGVADLIERAANMLSNTCAFNMSGHPAVSLPAGEVGGLPVGLMLIGARGRDAALLDAAAAVETLLAGEQST
jgi:amidase